MRKALIALAVVLALLFVAVLLVPVLFKDRILAAVNGALSEQVDADVVLGEVDLGVLSSFPNVSVEIDGLRVSNRAPFEGVVLADVGHLGLTLDLMSVVRGETVEVVGLSVIDPKLHLEVDAEGKANTDISKGESPPAAASADEKPSTYALNLKDYRIENLDLLYDDQQGGTFVELLDLDHKGEGKINQDRLHLATHTDIASLTVRDGGVGLLNKTRWAADVDLDLDQNNGQITFGDSTIKVNNLAMKLKGSVLPRGDDQVLDLTFSALETSFGSVLSLIPSVYKTDLKGYEVAGTFAMNGSVKGTLAAEGEDLPAFDLALTVEDGHFKGPDLPTALDAVQVDLAVHHPGGPTDLVEVDLRRFHMEITGSPLDGRLKLRHPTTDPDIDTQIKGRLDLASLRTALPPSDLSYKGTMDLDIDVAGRVSAFENAELDAVRARGVVQLKDTEYAAEDLPAPVQIDSMKLTLDPQRADLADFQLRIGASDLAAKGTVDNLVPYLLSDKPLKGRMELKSNFLDLDALSGDEPAARENKEKGTSTVTPVPKNLDLALSADLKRVRFDGDEYQDVNGTLSVKDGVLRLNPLSAKLLGGSLKLVGTYAAPTAKGADVDVQVQMDRFQVAETVDHFDTLGRLAPIAKGASGQFSSSFQLQTRLGVDMAPDLPTLFSKGSLSFVGVSVVPTFMEKVSDALKNKGIKGLDLNNTSLLYLVQNGKINLDGQSLRVGGLAASLAGSVGALDQTLDLKLDLSVPVGQIKATELLDSLGVAQDGDARLRIGIGGTYDKPTVKVSLADGSVVDNIREAATAAAVAVVGAEAQKLLDAAKAKGDELIAVAQKAADQLSAGAKEAGDKLRAEAKKQGDKLKAEAKGNPLAVAAANETAEKLNKEAKKKADKLQTEADRKGKAGVDAAKKEADRLVSDAQAKLNAAGK